MEPRISALAANVRRLRGSYGLSLAELADRCGVAKATLFKVERERTNPTLETLVALAEAFSVDVADLIALPDGPAVEVVRAGEGVDISDDVMTGRVLKSMLVGSTLIEIHDVTFLAGHSETSISHGAGAREHVLVRSGRLAVGPVEHPAELRAGDYATYTADQPHRWRVLGKSDARVWIVHSIPRAPGL